MLIESVYIPNEFKEIWKKIKAGAKAEKRGIGTYICQNWQGEKKDQSKI